MKYFFPSLFFLTIFSNFSFSQMMVNKDEAFMVLKNKSNLFPKFNRELNTLLETDSKMKEIKFVRTNGGKGPAWAGGGAMTFDLYYIENLIPNYDDNRLVVILYHELGHLYDNVSKSAAEREEQAFRFSIIKLKKIADDGDCGPLSTGLYFMRERSKSNDLSDPHNIGLKNLIQTNLFLDNEKYVANGCKESSDVLLKNKTKDLLLENLKEDFRSVREPLNYRELYYHSNTPKSHKSFFFIYVSKRDDGQIVLRLRIQYEGNSPIGVKSYFIKTEKREILINPSNNQTITRGNDGGQYYSIYDYPVNKYTLQAVKDIADAEEVEMTYYGSKGNDNRKIKEKEKIALMKTLQLYELMGGDMNFSN